MTDGNSMETQNTPGDGATNGLPDPTNPDQTSEDGNAAGSSVSAQVTTDHPQPPSQEDDEEAAPPEPKPTQTDHLNKSLLTSFLDRLNNPNMSNSFPAVQRIDTSDPEEALEIRDSEETNN